MIDQIRSCPTTSLTSLFKKKEQIFRYFSFIHVLYAMCWEKKTNNKTPDKQEINLWFVVYLMHYKAKAM